MRYIIIVACLLLFISCSQQQRTYGNIEKLDASLDLLIKPGATIEIIADSLDWSEGPLWIETKQMLLFSDIPENAIYKWTEAKGKELYLHPSGYTGIVQRGGEMGSNALLLNADGKLVLCQHGNRQMAMMDAPIDAPAPNFITIADSYQNKKFNSPNDAVYRSNGDLFFTDPPYGLEKNMEDPLKELPYQGVYMVKKNGEVKMLVDSITRPNGIAFLPGEKTLLISNSDDTKPLWYAYDIDANDSLINPRIFFESDATKGKGGADGMKADRNGNVFATGPGGVWIFNDLAHPIGKIALPGRCSNVALTTDEKTLFITADMYVLRVKMRD